MLMRRNCISFFLINKYKYYIYIHCIAMLGKKHVIIGTTSINRPELHANNIPEWAAWIDSLDSQKYDINWFINIDFIDSLKTSVAQTQSHYKTLIPLRIHTHFMNSEPSAGNFLKACKRVSQSIEQYVVQNQLPEEDVIIIWLEDDWKLNPRGLPLQNIIEEYLSNNSCINLSYIRCNYIHALAPCIINYVLWKSLHFSAWEAQKDHIDPEHCVGLWALKHICANGTYASLQNVTVFDHETAPNTLTANNSLYTYSFSMLGKEIPISDKYIPKSEFLEKIKDVVTFIRISHSHCLYGVNYGRSFMENHNLFKNRIQTNTELDFYKSINTA
jgi:hypothetical protein